MFHSLRARRFVSHRPLLSFAVILTLLAVDGLAGSVSVATADPAAVGIVPVVDVRAPELSGTNDGGRSGGQATRIEFDDTDLNASMSAWYRLAYVEGGDRLRVYEHYDATTDHPDPVIINSETVAWRLANEVVGLDDDAATTDQVPSWAHPHTGIDTGPSAGLMFTLAYLDALTPGPLVGNLRVAGTGGMGHDGVVVIVSNVEIKVAAAMLTRPDVIFAPRPPESVEHVTIVESHHTRNPNHPYTIGQWLNVNGYEQAGRLAASLPGTTAVVVVHDLRQALAWLCGRTDNATTCALARMSATIPIGTV
jgi:hypothetical protein